MRIAPACTKPLLAAACVLAMGVAPSDGSDRVAVAAGPARRIVLLPFVARGAPPGGWLPIQPLIEAELAGRGVEVVDYGRVEGYLKEHRLRDTSILSREEIAALGASFDADHMLTGSLYRWDEGTEPVVSLSGRITDAEGSVERMTMTVLEGSTLLGPLGGGGPVTMERTMQEAARQFVNGLLGGGEGSPRREIPKLLKRSVFAPEPLAYMSPALGGRRIGRVTVMPFRNNVDRPGAGHVAADAFAWCLLEAGEAVIVDAGDATRRLLEQGWRTGRAVGRSDVIRLHEALGVDAVLMGSIDSWEEGSRRGKTPPSVSLSARLLDGATGEILWTATHERRGDETRSVYEIGNVRLPEALVARSAHEILAPILSSFEKPPVTIGESPP